MFIKRHSHRGSQGNASGSFQNSVRNSSNIIFIVKQFRSSCSELSEVKGFVKDPDKMDQHVLAVKSPDHDHLLSCLDYIVKEKMKSSDRRALFHSLIHHFRFGPSYTKLTFVEHSLRHLMKDPTEWEQFKRFRQGESYDIYSKIRDNPVMVGVYTYHLGVPTEATVELADNLSTRYENTPISLEILVYRSALVQICFCSVKIPTPSPLLGT